MIIGFSDPFPGSLTWQAKHFFFTPRFSRVGEDAAVLCAEIPWLEEQRSGIAATLSELTTRDAFQAGTAPVAGENAGHRGGFIGWGNAEWDLHIDYFVLSLDDDICVCDVCIGLMRQALPMLHAPSLYCEECHESEPDPDGVGGTGTCGDCAELALHPIPGVSYDEEGVPRCQQCGRELERPGMFRSLCDGCRDSAEPTERELKEICAEVSTRKCWACGGETYARQKHCEWCGEPA